MTSGKKKDYIMKNVSYFKFQAKNLFHDFKLDFMQDGENYVFAPRFFDINAIISAFNVDIDNFTLMKAQHVIAQMVGMVSWNELINSPENILEQKKIVLDNSNFKINRQKIYNIDLSGYEKIDQGKAGDYVLKCPLLPELKEIMSLKPNCYFMSCNKTDLKKLSADTAHIYVNVVPQNASMRILVHGVYFPDWYAVSVKNIGNM